MHKGKVDEFNNVINIERDDNLVRINRDGTIFFNPRFNSGQYYFNLKTSKILQC